MDVRLAWLVCFDVDIICQLQRSSQPDQDNLSKCCQSQSDFVVRQRRRQRDILHRDCQRREHDNSPVRSLEDNFCWCWGQKDKYLPLIFNGSSWSIELFIVLQRSFVIFFWQTRTWWRDCSEETDNLRASQVCWQNRKHTLWRRGGERILNVNGDGCDRKKIAGRRIRRELKIRESEKLEDDNHNNSPCN